MKPNEAKGVFVPTYFEHGSLISPLFLQGKISTGSIDIPAVKAES